jgi:hypothetical protein
MGREIMKVAAQLLVSKVEGIYGSDLGTIARLVEEGDKEMLVDYLLKSCSFNRKKGAITMAEELFKAKDQLDEEGLWNNPFGELLKYPPLKLDPPQS